MSYRLTFEIFAYYFFLNLFWKLQKFIYDDHDISGVKKALIRLIFLSMLHYGNKKIMSESTTRRKRKEENLSAAITLLTDAN